jgi:REP element-mobilizing transposase RayT
VDDPDTLEKQTSFTIYEPVEETISVEVTVSNDIPEVVLEQVPQEYYNLSYTCLLVSKFPNHRLSGDIGEFLPNWVRDTCIAYGWRLEFVQTGAEYLQWALQVPPSESPARFLRIFRHQTSKHIFENFGRIRRENPSDDFWAMGHFIQPGIRYLPAETTTNYVNFIRRQQGIQSSF